MLDALLITRRALCSSEAIERIAFENVEDAWRDGTKLLELRFTPAILAASSGLGEETVIEAALDGVLRGMRRYPLEVGLIGTLRRKAAPQTNERVAAELLAAARGSAPRRPAPGGLRPGRRRARRPSRGFRAR